jgi:hypothetical protein
MVLVVLAVGTIGVATTYSTANRSVTLKTDVANPGPVASDSMSGSMMTDSMMADSKMGRMNGSTTTGNMMGDTMMTDMKMGK